MHYKGHENNPIYPLRWSKKKKCFSTAMKFLICCSLCVERAYTTYEVHSEYLEGS